MDTDWNEPGLASSEFALPCLRSMNIRPRFWCGIRCAIPGSHEFVNGDEVVPARVGECGRPAAAMRTSATHPAPVKTVAGRRELGQVHDDDEDLEDYHGSAQPEWSRYSRTRRRVAACTGYSDLRPHRLCRRGRHVYQRGQ
uniref:Uncharacterized protein n=1 Tax=Setaria viridis TaxID=4556 RepID=A0A4U6URN4_SETVI|nr:hypothetical protein SEVIR_5G391800v2 [Setaria viridis]